MACASSRTISPCHRRFGRGDVHAIIDLSRLRASRGFMTGEEVTRTRAAISRPRLSSLITALVAGIKDPRLSPRSPGTTELKRSSPPPSSPSSHHHRHHRELTTQTWGAVCFHSLVALLLIACLHFNSIARVSKIRKNDPSNEIIKVIYANQLCRQLIKAGEPPLESEEVHLFS